MSSLRRAVSTKYIILSSALAFILWSLATSVLSTSSIFSALLQIDLNSSTTVGQQVTSDPSSLETRPVIGIGIPHAYIYVISLANRQDRRSEMEYLRKSQNLTWTIIDAIPSNATLVNRILDRVAFQRAESTTTSTMPFCWPEDINARAVSFELLAPSGSDTWSDAPPLNTSQIQLGAPRARPAQMWCAIQDEAMPTFMNETPEWMVLSPAKIACWHSHVLAIRRFLEGRDVHGHGHERWDDVAVILEDDIDMERDISIRLSHIWTSLPPGWDIVFLGHCWSDEAHYPPLTDVPDTNLHPSYYPKCTHAYALSLSGARRLLQHLRYPRFAYSRALDQAYAWLVRSGRLRSYSIVPSVVVQRKRGQSDILPGSGSEWRQGLSDGVFDALE